MTKLRLPAMLVAVDARETLSPVMVTKEVPSELDPRIMLLELFDPNSIVWVWLTTSTGSSP